ncbi:MAG: hypothetical protein V4627_02790 [Pseudomonadota bacterium]
MSTEVFLWWCLLCAVSAVNVVGLSLSVPALKRRHARLPAEIYASRRLQLLLSAGYVLGCAYRSVLPVYDVQRLCLVDSWMSSVIVGRTVATIAELCFVTQWALLLRELSHATDDRLGRATAQAIVPMIVVAEVFSWYSVLTTSNIGHVVEETLWGVSAALLVLSLVSIWPRSSKPLRPYLLLCGMVGAAYVWYMFAVDVPMYWSRWVEDEASGRKYLSVLQGAFDASSRWVVSHQWQDWQSEVVWMSLYFSVAVWFSIALVHAPFLAHRRVPVAPGTPCV